MHPKLINYNKELFERLTRQNQKLLLGLLKKYPFTFQQLRLIMEGALDLEAWGVNLKRFTNSLKDHNPKTFFDCFQDKIKGLVAKPPSYNKKVRVSKQPPLNLIYINEKKKIFGFCPVRSDKTLCCNLRTLDLVIGCGFGCNYCAIKSTVKKNKIIFHKNLAELLDSITLSPNEFYHIGTGQSSDALLWENTGGMLDWLVKFAKRNPNAFIELKTKSDKISYLLNNEIPKNIFPSFTLNPHKIIAAEEPYTASLNARLAAAKKCIKKGIKVAFHFHPIIHFNGWEVDYEKLVKRLLQNFEPEQVIFISLGTLHYAKAVVKEIRFSGTRSSVLKMPFALNPEKKLTYPPEIKDKLFNHVYFCFKDWHGKVFFYLCMEEKSFSERLFNISYRDNLDFEKHLLDEIMKKL
jgi:spore photoproduct lyase